MEEIPLSRSPLRQRAMHPNRTRGGFRTVSLNAIGWAVLIGAGLALGAGAALTTSISPQVALPGGVSLTWGLLLVADSHRWRNSTSHIGRDDMDAATGASVVARLQEMGITATYREDTYDDEDGLYTQRGIVCRRGDAETVRSVMEAEVSEA